METDIGLVAALLRGDVDSLRVLYERHGGRVYRTAYRFLGDEEDASDVTQSVFLTLAQGAGGYRPDAPFGAWLHRVVVNRCLNLRSAAHRRLVHLPVDGGDVDSGMSVVSTQPTPERALQRRQSESLVHTALSRLPARQRMAVVLCKLEGLSYAEAAQAMGCSTSAVESLLFRAGGSLRKALGEGNSK